MQDDGKHTNHRRGGLSLNDLDQQQLLAGRFVLKRNAQICKEGHKTVGTLVRDVPEVEEAMLTIVGTSLVNRQLAVLYTGMLWVHW